MINYNGSPIKPEMTTTSFKSTFVEVYSILIDRAIVWIYIQ